MHLYRNKTLNKHLQKTRLRPGKEASNGHGKDKPELDTGILHHDFCYSYEKAAIKQWLMHFLKTRL